MQAFYTQLHDGFKLAFAFHNGFPSTADLFALGEDLDAESIELIGATAAPNLDEVIPVFFDFGASSVCIELVNPVATDSNGWVTSDSQLQPVDDIWAIINRWILASIGP